MAMNTTTTTIARAKKSRESLALFFEAVPFFHAVEGDAAGCEILLHDFSERIERADGFIDDE